MIRRLLLTTALLAFSISAGSADIIAHWTFEGTVPTTSGPHLAEAGIQAGSAAANGFHTNGAAAYSNPSGNGSVESFSSNTWSADDWYQFQVDLTGYVNATVQWDQTRSSTGPGDFRLEYSLDGTNFNLIQNYTIDAISWSSGSYNSLSTFGAVALPGATDNQSTVYIRMTANVAGSGTSGTNRIDDVIVDAAPDSGIPEPGTGLVLAMLSVVGLAATRRRG